MNNIPIKGGRLVNDLNTGTNSRQSNPKMSMVLRSRALRQLSEDTGESCPDDEESDCFVKPAATIQVGRINDTTPGSNRLFIIAPEVMLLLIHSM